MDEGAFTFNLDKPLFFCRISISLPITTNVAEETVYFRCRMTYDFTERWSWYFEYLAALLKIHNPKRKVWLDYGKMDPKMKLGKDFIEYRKVTMIRNKAKRIERLKTEPFLDDLFGFASKDRNAKITELQNDLKELEDGNVTFPVLKDYINEVKRYTTYSIKSIHLNSTLAKE